MRPSAGGYLGRPGRVAGGHLNRIVFATFCNLFAICVSRTSSRGQAAVYRELRAY